jgi:hypothetical protein
MKGDYYTFHQLENDLVRCSITHVNGKPVPPPYLANATFLDWTLRTLHLVRAAFKDVNDTTLVAGMILQATGRVPPAPVASA